MYSFIIIFTIILTSFIFIQKSEAGILLSFEPAVQDVVLGNQAVVDIVVSGLGSYTSPSVGSFDFNVTFDDILEFDHYVLGTELGDLLIAEALDLSSGLVGIGDINLAEVSFVDPESLMVNQPESFVLATLYFNTIAPGTSTLRITSNQFLGVILLGDEYGSQLSFTTQEGTINVISQTGGGTVTQPIPEPATLILMGAGFAGLGFYRRRKSN